MRIPKLREGSYFPDDIVEKWSRTDTALASAVCDMWAAGVSTRKVEKVMADMGVESMSLSLIHISEPTRRRGIAVAVVCV